MYRSATLTRECSDDLTIVTTFALRDWPSLYWQLAREVLMMPDIWPICSCFFERVSFLAWNDIGGKEDCRCKDH